MPEKVNPADIGMEITPYRPTLDRETAKTAFQMIVSGMSLDQICLTLGCDVEEKAKLLELVVDYQDEEIEVYKKTYRTLDIVRLNNWLLEIDESLRSSNSKRNQPALIAAGLRVLEFRTKLLDEVTGNRKAVASIDFSIEGVDLSMI